MKTSNSLLAFTSLLFMFVICMVVACKNNGNQQTAMPHKPDTTFVPRIDTIIVHNPDSPDMDRIRIMKSIDTVIKK